MKLFDKIYRLYNEALSRRRVGIYDPKSGDELWYAYLSPLGLALAAVALVVILFVANLAIVAYTPVLEQLPGYRSSVVRSRESLVENIMRLDSLERVISDVMVYNENVALIMDGKSPVVRDIISRDSLKLNKSFLAPNAADSTLRLEMAGASSIAARAKYQQRVASGDAAVLVAPAEGELVAGFDLSQESFGVEIDTPAESRVMAVGDGMVLGSNWLPSLGYSVEILHAESIISVYTNMSQSLVEKGQLVKNGEVIGFSPAADGDKKRCLGFEIWSGGKPANPEEYILFN